MTPITSSAFRTVFEMTFLDLPWWTILPGALLFFIGKMMKVFPGDRRQVMSALFMGFAILWMVAWSCSLFMDFRLLHEYRSGRYQTVEGTVTDFHPMPPMGHANESFVVNGIRFSYSNFAITPCFNRTAVN